MIERSISSIEWIQTKECADVWIQEIKYEVEENLDEQEEVNLEMFQGDWEVGDDVHGRIYQ
eukprot:11029390-Karenia_brevis.AAC.1